VPASQEGGGFRRPATQPKPFTRNSIADGIACTIGYENACDTTSIPKSRSCESSRRWTKGGGDTESGTSRQG
jgi:hypothetical protein